LTKGVFLRAETTGLLAAILARPQHSEEGEGEEEDES
jgi:hypothetical protein